MIACMRERVYVSVHIKCILSYTCAQPLNMGAAIIHVCAMILTMEKMSRMSSLGMNNHCLLDMHKLDWSSALYFLCNWVN